MGYKTVILDFDGVIVESTNIKTDAFGEIFSEEKDYIDEIIQFHLNNSGLSRYDKFRYIYKNILRRPLLDEEFNKLCERFSTYVFNRVGLAPFVKGAEEFIKQFGPKLPIFIVSATPHEEVNLIVSKRGLKGYFKGIYGSPKKKAEWIDEILRSNELQPREALFVGDTKEDYKAALENGVDFILRYVNEKDDFYLTKPTVRAILPDLERLQEFVVIK